MISSISLQRKSGLSLKKIFINMGESFYLRYMTDAKIVAEKLLQVNAVKLNLDQPFTWASGWKSPIYCDNRRILSFPFIRDYIKSELSNVVFDKFPDAG